MTGWSETVSPITQVPARRVLAMEPVAVRQAFLIRAFAIVGAVAMLVSAGTAFGRAAPESFADLAAKLLPSVVNISTSQTIKRSGTRGNPEGTPQQRPQLPPGSPFEEFFKEFFDRQGRGESAPRRAQSLG